MVTKAGNPRGTGEWRKVRMRVLNRDQWTCYYCGNEANQVDHIVPIKDEPSMAFDESNLVSACKKCNQVKGSRSQAVFLSGFSTPPVLANHIYPTTTGTVQPGPMDGQPRPSQP